MPIRKVEGGYKWGDHGHVYPNRAGAERQAAAAHAHGFKGDSTPRDPIESYMDAVSRGDAEGMKGAFGK